MHTLTASQARSNLYRIIDETAASHEPVVIAGKRIHENPLQNPPPYEKLVGDLAGAYSRRINIQHRLVYQILEDHATMELSCHSFAGDEKQGP